MISNRQNMLIILPIFLNCMVTFLCSLIYRSKCHLGEYFVNVDTHV